MATEHTPQARLERMLAEGKITREQFEDLKAALGPVGVRAGREEPPRDIPGPAVEGQPPSLPLPGSAGSRPDSGGPGTPPPLSSEALAPAGRSQPRDRAPLSLWVCIGILVVAGLSSLLLSGRGHSRNLIPAPFLAAVLDFTLAWFLYLRWQWAFYVAMAVAVLAVLVAVAKLAILGAIFNAVFLVFLWKSRDWFLKAR